MLGQFIFTTCNRADLRMSAFLRNTSRKLDAGVVEEKSNSHIYVSLKIFHSGNLIADYPNYRSIPPEGYCEISDKSCPVLADRDKEFLFVAQCRRGDEAGYFPQEHQVVYESIRETRSTSLVYDQLPFTGSATKPILLLAPKVWISKNINTLISISSANVTAPIDMNDDRWKIDFISQEGVVLRSMNILLKQNDSYLLDVKKALAGYLDVTDQLRFLTVVARGNSAGCVILTFVQNEVTGALALEHSLSPHYYMNGDFGRVRKEAFLFLQ